MTNRWREEFSSMIYGDNDTLVIKIIPIITLNDESVRFRDKYDYNKVSDYGQIVRP